jgi:hypothetical protein
MRRDFEVHEEMGLSNKKEEQLRSMPVIQSRLKTSKNGRYIIQQTVITSVKPIEYYKAVLANTVKVTEEPLEEDELMIEEGSEIAKRIR